MATRTSWIRRMTGIAAAACWLLTAGVGAADTLHYGFELEGRLVGYAEIETGDGTGSDSGERVVRSRVSAKLTLLGQAFDLSVEEVYRIDRATGRVVSYESDIRQGPMKAGSTVRVEGDEIRFAARSGGAPQTRKLPPDVILDNGLEYPYLLRDLGSGEAEEKTYRILDYSEGTVQEVSARRVASEVIRVPGGRFACSVFELRDAARGLTTRIWVDRDTARWVRIEMSTGVTLYRADPAVVGKIRRADLDDLLLVRVDVPIADFRSLTYLKVRAVIRTVGENVSAASLTVPGQTFTGAVEDNRIDGIFEIEHRRYEGTSAPPFPPDFSSEGSLARYLAPETLVESDDPVLVAKGRELAQGSRDAWEAACRLSEWVAEEIAYEIPGASARQTFDSRKGECGAHSRLLVALCRGVGVPARIVSGCMYTPSLGGSFGQHAWTEVFMGEAGWIPVDPTANEIDFVDSGHIRLGEVTSFRPESMEILDYRPRPEPTDEDAKISFEELPWETGIEHRYRYRLGESPLGTDSFTLEREEGTEGSTLWSCRFEIDLTGRTVSGEWKIDASGRPVSYRLEGKAGGVEYSIDCEFADGRVIEKATQAGRNIERTIDLPEGVILLDNNNFSLFAFLLAGMPRTEGTSRTLKAFHPTSMQVLAIRFTFGGKEPIRVGETEIEARRCDVVFAGTPLVLWLDEAGRVVRETEGSGRLVVELVTE